MPQSTSKVLLVEGIDDKHVVHNIWTVNQNDNSLPFLIKPCGGINNLLRSIPVELKFDGLESIGILVDANDDIQNRWSQVINWIIKSGYSIQVPQNPVQYGTIIPSIPRIGVWIMPDNHSKGELESFVQRLIPMNDSIWKRAQQYVADIPTEERKFKPHKEMRAMVHAWLAVREKPRQMGGAIRTGDLDGKSSLALKFNCWLNSLFVSP